MDAFYLWILCNAYKERETMKLNKERWNGSKRDTKKKSSFCACLTARKIWISIDDSWPNLFLAFSLCSRVSQSQFFMHFNIFWYEYLYLYIYINELANVLATLVHSSHKYNSWGVCNVLLVFGDRAPASVRSLYLLYLKMQLNSFGECNSNALIVVALLLLQATACCIDSKIGRRLSGVEQYESV